MLGGWGKDSAALTSMGALLLLLSADAPAADTQQASSRKNAVAREFACVCVCVCVRAVKGVPVDGGSAGQETSPPLARGHAQGAAELAESSHNGQSGRGRKEDGEQLMLLGHARACRRRVVLVEGVWWSCCWSCWCCWWQRVAVRLRLWLAS